MAYLLHTWTVEPEKQPLLSNTRARQWKSGVFYGVHIVNAAMHRRGKHTSSTIETVFSAKSVPTSHLEDNWRYIAVEGSAVEC